MTDHSTAPRGTTMERRTFLRGLGTVMALPLLESLIPSGAFAAEARRQGVRRMAFVYVPNGAHMADWTPAATGAEFALPPILEPLAPFRSHLTVL
ncbi:MAG TPA: DUF1552 domain-containing protein, partial [Candidatus Methylomirabilis sp.]|nr:DUF1552 domain-containing protein [Candidatus Methylomirabilis sp.]